ncbi:hypothetical protein ACHAXT_006949 [Thalassiosira profunda]
MANFCIDGWCVHPSAQMSTAAGKKGEQPPLGDPQKKSVSRRARCSECACQQFQSDAAVASAVNSDAEVDALIDWLSGAPTKDSDEARISLRETSNLCPGRLRESIGILNAIRDACRPYLETTAPSPAPSAPSPQFGKNTKTAINGHATYEESFPSLSSVASTEAPTMLVGRKKSKGAKVGNNPPVPPASSVAAPTMLVGRKKSKAPKNNSKQQQTKGTHAATGAGSKKESSSSNQVNGLGGVTARKAKKKIKPVTISPSTSASEGTTQIAHNSIRFEGNIASLPSQETSELMGPAASRVTPQCIPESIAEDESPQLNAPQLSNTTNDETTEMEIKPGSRERLMRLARVYATILKSHLAPFLLLEFHLLVRLLSLSDESKMARPSESTSRQYSDLFWSAHSCQDFAADVLTGLESVLVNLGHETIKLFAALPALKSQCPQLYRVLQDVVDAGNAALMFEADQKALGSARDSRHNYRSPDLNRVYKEREGLRDAFLYQLRAFQDVRGKLMEHEQAEKRLESIRHESREMLKHLSPGNTLWFVNLFCELLLQIGLVPISETDSEVLKQIGCEKRLQKLHMRFTSKSGHANESSRRIHIDQKGPSSISNAADQSFPGHQEYFSMFLRAGDSYKFNVQLKRRLAEMITERTAVNETKGLCDHMARTQMLAKYLGLLVFSPNWDISAGNGSDSPSIDNLPPIDVKGAVEDAWEQSRLIAVVPWVIQFLAMMKWDEVSRKTQYYVDTFTLLWSINHHCLPYQIERHSYCQTNMALLSLQLDGLFHDVVGLAPTHCFSIMDLPSRKQYSADDTDLIALDELPLWFSKSFLFPSTPHLKDLCELLTDLAKNQGRKSITASTRKIRRTVSNIASPISISGDSAVSPWSSRRPGTPTHQGGIKERLVDAFFHQHRDLQQLCGVIVDNAIRNFSETVSRSCIPPILRNGATSFEQYLTKDPSMTIEEYAKLLGDLEAKAANEATAMMTSDFDRIIRGALPLLAPAEKNPKVVDIASTLAINHAKDKAKAIVRRIISDERKKLLDEFIRKEKKYQFGVPLSSAKKGTAPQQERTSRDGSSLPSIARLTVLLESFQDLGGSSSDKLAEFKEAKSNALSCLDGRFISPGSFGAIAEFEKQILSQLRTFFSDPSNGAFSALAAAIEVAEVWSLLAKLGYAASPNEELEALLCDSSNLLALINQESPLGHEDIGNFLFQLVDGSLLNYRSLEKALMHAVTESEDAKAISRLLMKQLASSRAGVVNAADGLVIMVRLQRMLLSDEQK